VEVFIPLVRVTAAERDTSAVAAGAKRLGAAFQILDQGLGRHDFLVSNSLSFADIEIGALLYRYFTMPIERPALPNVEAYYDRLKTRPAYQKRIMLDWTNMKIPGA